MTKQNIANCVVSNKRLRALCGTGESSKHSVESAQDYGSLQQWTHNFVARHAGVGPFDAACLGAALVVNFHYAVLRVFPAIHTHLASLHSEDGRCSAALPSATLIYSIQNAAFWCFSSKACFLPCGR